MEELKIVYLPIDKLKPYKKNARKHGKDDIAAIRASIRELGFNDPIGIWSDENIIVEGHGRLIAAKAEGITEVPCIRLDHLTDEQRRAYALAHNRTAELSMWDELIKEEELREIHAVDMSALGFDLPEKETKLEPEEALEEIPKQAMPRVQRGQIWKLGEHRLMCGDSTSADDVQRLMGGVLADMVFTDPPYGVAIGSKNEVLNEVGKGSQLTENIRGDTLAEDKLFEVLKSAFINIRENCADDAVYYVTSPQGGSLGLMMMMMMKEAGLEVRHVLMWLKNAATFSIGRLDYDYQHEPIFYTWTKKHHNFRKGESRTTVWAYNKPQKNDIHPTMKPVELVENAILDGTQKGMSVLDAFGGSGTTLIAAERLNRKCFMMELDEHYCDVIIERWEKLTGKTAELISS